MPAIVYRITEVLSALVLDLPIGTNLGLFHILWALLSGRLLQSRGALFPAVAGVGLDARAVRRAWRAFGYGSWTIAKLMTSFLSLVEQEGRWQPKWLGGYRVVAVDTVAFFRPRLKECLTKHFLSQAGTALPAISLGLIVNVGSAAEQRVPIVRQLVRAPHAAASEAELVETLLHQAANQLAADEVLVADRGFSPLKLQAAGVARWVARVPRNFSARRIRPTVYPGRGRPATRGEIVRPLPRTYQAKALSATPPDRTETTLFAGRQVRADIWEGLRLPQGPAQPAALECVVIHDPNYSDPWVLVTNLTLSVLELLRLYRQRWAIEQVPLAAKQLLGAQRQFVSATDARQRLPELALLAGSLLMYLAATSPLQPTGFWDRAPRPTAGRLRRVLAQLDISKFAALPHQLRKKESVTTHLPMGIAARRLAIQSPAPQT